MKNPQDQSLLPSATVVLCHQEDGPPQSFNVLLLRRNSKLQTHGGSWVFPGGKVDAADYLAANLSKTIAENTCFFALDEDQQTHVARITATREAHEEAGVELDPHSLHFISRWITPETLKKRFDTRFFITQTTTPDIQIDGSEIHDALWITPATALAQYRKGLMILPPPTFITLTCLANYTNINNAFRCLGRQVRCYRPKLTVLNGELCSLYEEDAAYHLTPGNPDDTKELTGARQHRLIMKQGDFQYIDQAISMDNPC